ncbi:uncharacterized protein LOC144169228 isoform X1 [Haemaphysalis longicornis]
MTEMTEAASRSPWTPAASSAIRTSSTCTSGSELSSAVSHCSTVLMSKKGSPLCCTCLLLIIVNMTSLCGDRQTGVYLVEPIVRCCPYMQVDGAVLTDEGNHHPNCVVTFQTHSIFQRLQLRFERLALDCNERLVLVDGRHPDGPHMANLTCETSVSDVGTLLTRTDFVTLKYDSDESSTPTQDRGFKLVITAFKQSHPQDAVAEQEVPCRDFKCANGFCISSNLTCDGVNHCGDNSDETGSAACVAETSSAAAPQ